MSSWYIIRDGSTQKIISSAAHFAVSAVIHNEDSERRGTLALDIELDIEEQYDKIYRYCYYRLRDREQAEDVFHAPAPTRKAAFLKKYRRRELGRQDFLLTQAGYIRWWIWAASVLMFGSVLWLSSGWESEKVWVSSALTPLLALLAVVENGKSCFYDMEELELSCRMPLRTIMLARMMILGLFHLLLLGLLIPVTAAWGAVGFFQAGLYLLTPYLLTTALGMELTRRCRGQEGLLACGGATVLVSAVGLLAGTGSLKLYLPEYLPWWYGALAIVAPATILEFALKIRKAEELQWN